MEQRLLRAVAANEVAEAAGLLQQGASVHCVNAHGDSPLAVACRTGCKRLVKVALRYGANINLQNHVNGNTPLHESHCGGHAAQPGGRPTWPGPARRPPGLAHGSPRYTINPLLPE